MMVLMTASRRRQFGAWIGLVAVALVAGTAWRIEVERGDAADMWWISYFHWAVPVGCLLFVGWATAVSASLARVTRVTLALALVGVSFAGMGLAERSLRVLLAPFYVAQPLSGWDLAWYVAAAVFLAAVPLLVAMVARFARLRVTWGRLIVSEAIWLASPLAAMGVIAVFFPHGHAGHPYGPDFAHAIKTGFVVPPLVVSLGILFMPRPAAADK